MRFLTRQNIRKFLGIVFIVTGSVFLLASIINISDNYYFNSKIFSLIYGLFSMVAGYGVLKNTSWAVYGFGASLFLEILGESIFTESGLGMYDVFLFIAGLVAMYFLFKKNVGKLN